MKKQTRIMVVILLLACMLFICRTPYSSNNAMSSPTKENIEIPPEITVNEGYELDEFGVSSGDKYTFSIYQFRHSEDAFLLYWKIVVMDNDEIKDILLVENNQYAVFFPSVEKMVLEVDVNFDGNSDVLICTGCIGNQNATVYKCYLTLEDKLAYCPSFSNILNPCVDPEKQVIWSAWRINNGYTHGWGKYCAEENAFILKERLISEASSNQGIVTWTDEIRKNNTWIPRESFIEDEENKDEIHEKVFGTSSIWGISERSILLSTLNYD